ncbi:hypothetical protein [Vibrio mangrovi]|uniref:Uncharacterized protein n=1 Tax=Vibrio mangrovi TaxID=474394 RepID=A0A1Y6IVB4_9VIBR|nr:hypothetical protein [Vibrio mangrovi]MDW6002259.1 hypothetical protein [Vibrio mangrovi]SMS01605.1 hypothetical protein VIM7927_02902 [Vibrio mangrovi]
MKAWIAFLLTFIFSVQVYSGSLPQDEKLLQSLIQRGVICQGLTYDEQQEALRIYLSERQKINKDKSSETAAEPEENSSESCIAPPKK